MSRTSEVTEPLEPTPLRRRLRSAIGIGVLLSLVGCKGTRHEECRVFVYTVNTRLQEIDRVAAEGAAARNVDAADMRRLAGLYEQLAEKSGAISIRSPDLNGMREQYRTMVLDAARLARAIADALDAKQLDAAMKAQERFTAVVSREDELVSRVNSFCGHTE